MGIPPLKPIVKKSLYSEEQRLKANKYREANKEAFNARKKAWRERNRDRVNKAMREWRARNKEHVRAMNDLWHEKNPEKTREQQKRTRIKNKEKLKAWHTKYRRTSEKRRQDLKRSNNKYSKKPEVKIRNLKGHLSRTFGITLEEFNDRLLKQNGVCGICNGTNRNGRRLSVDHDHITGRVRGLLCSNCNMAIGLMHDNPDLFNKTAAYLKY